MKMNLIKQFSDKKKKIALLIDPEKTTAEKAVEIAINAQKNNFSFIFIGGSLISVYLDNYISKIKKGCDIPVILFPGSTYQISDKADGILFLSLISGRNPEYLIGQHVTAAPLLKRSKLNIIPTGYILLESGNITSVEYMSNTKPIPQTKTDIVTATAVAGEMLGLKMIYLEGGSGAENRVKDTVIKEVKKNISIPLIVGGGIANPNHLKEVFNAGADIAVIGTAVEINPDLITQFGKVIKGYL